MKVPRKLKSENAIPVDELGLPKSELELTVDQNPRYKVPISEEDMPDDFDEVDNGNVDNAAGKEVRDPPAVKLNKHGLPKSKFPPYNMPSTSWNATISFVISHCHDRIKWINKVLPPLCKNNDVHIYFYEKCNDAKHASKFQKKRRSRKCKSEIIHLPNVGREGHTFIYHILNRTKELQDMNFFVQGEFEACPHEIKNALRNMSRIVHRKGKTLTNHWINIKHFGCPAFPKKYFGKAKQKKMHEFRMCEWYKQITGTMKGCSTFNVGWRGEWVATKAMLEWVIAKQRKTLENFYRVLGRETNPIEGYYLEMLWSVIFDHHHGKCEETTKKGSMMRIFCKPPYNY